MPAKTANEKRHRDREDRITQLSRLYTRHGSAWTHEQYGKALGLKRPTITKMLIALEKRWAKEQVENIDQHKERILRTLEEIKVSALEEWQRSGGGAERLTKDGGVVTLKSFRGAEYLRAALDAMNQQRGILGLDKPSKVDMTSGGAPFKIQVVYDDDGDSGPVPDGD